MRHPGSPLLLLALFLGCARGVTITGSGGSGGAVGGSGGSAGGSGGSITGPGGSGGTGNEGTGGVGNSGTGGVGNSGTGGAGNSGNSGSGNSGNMGSGNSGNAGSGASGGAMQVDCNPLNPTPGCGANQHCLPNTDGIPECAPAGAGMQFTLCQSIGECAPIFECVSDGIDACCLQYCTSDLDCGLGLSCAFFQTPIYVGPTEYGVCTDGLPCVI